MQNPLEAPLTGPPYVQANANDDVNGSSGHSEPSERSDQFELFRQKLRELLEREVALKDREVNSLIKKAFIPNV